MSSLSSTPCVVEKCELASLALCQCCKKDLCIDHLNEHANQRNGKLLPFIDKINVLLNRFSDFYDGDRSIQKQLDQWRDEAFKVIENFYEKKRRELSDETTDQQREQLNEIHHKLKDLIRKKGGTQQDFDKFSVEMRSIEQYLDKLQQTELTLPPLTIDDHCLPRSLPTATTTASATIQTDPIEPTPTKSSEHSDNSPQKSNEKKKSSKKRKKSSRHSDDGSSDRSSHRRSRSPHRHSERSKKRK